MKKSILFLVVPMFFMAVASEAAEIVEARVYSESKINRFRRKDHPFKLGYCLGRDTETSSSDVDNIVSSQNSSGRIERRESGGHSDISDFYFGAMNWNIEMSPQDVLKFSFSQDTTRSERSDTNMLCNTTVTTSHLLRQKSTIEGALLITVPQNSFVLRIKNTELKANIGIRDFATSYKVLNRETKRFEDVRLPAFGDDQYLYVRPGDIVKIHMSFSTEDIEKVDFKVAYEVGFLGSYKCEEILNNGVAQTTKSIVSRVLKSSSPTPRELDALLIKSSCLRNPLVTRELFVNSYGSDLAEMIYQLTNLSNNLEQNMTLVSSVVSSVYSVTLRLLILDMSKHLLEDLYLFCKPVQLKSFFDIPSEFTTLTRKYNIAAINYLKIKYTIDLTVSPVLKDFVRYLQSNENKNSTFAQLSNPVDLKVLNSYAEDVLSDDLINYSNIITLLKEISGTETGARIRDLLNSKLVTANDISRDLHWQLKLIFRGVGKKSTELIVTAGMSQRISQLEALNYEILSLIQKDLIWFENKSDSSVDSAFTTDLYNINNKVMQKMAYSLRADAARNGALNEAVINANPNFRPIIELESILSLNGKVNQCLSSAKD